MKRFSLYIASIIFLMVAIAHVIRYILGMEVIFGTHHIPLVVSFYGAIFSFILFLWMLIAASFGNKPKI